MSTLILVAIVMASLVAALFFLRFWRDTRDRFFCASRLPSLSMPSIA
jgi:hypothetical protein